MKEIWIDIKDNLPEPNTLVKVLLTNGCISYDYVNTPFDEVCPFQHFIVSKWRLPTTVELGLLHREIMLLPKMIT